MQKNNAKDIAKKVVETNVQNRIALKYKTYQAALETIDKYFEFETKRNRKGEIILVVKKNKAKITEEDATTLRCFKNGTL